MKFKRVLKKDLKKLDKPTALKILDGIKILKDYPLVSNIKKLKNFYPPFRYRINDYRVLFDIEDDRLIIFNIKHRKEAYK
ncbi:MAG: type II toxin-antitoxin system RelE/ParE family toxin [Campylobacterales bacterium]|nr:type II toxin-antitoxin system RelE/ParE family toxin [Campylobacterales bacterium]